MFRESTTQCRARTFDCQFCFTHVRCGCPLVLMLMSFVRKPVQIFLRINQKYLVHMCVLYDAYFDYSFFFIGILFLTSFSRFPQKLGQLLVTRVYLAGLVETIFWSRQFFEKYSSERKKNVCFPNSSAWTPTYLISTKTPSLQASASLQRQARA